MEPLDAAQVAAQTGATPRVESPERKSTELERALDVISKLPEPKERQFGRESPERAALRELVNSSYALINAMRREDAKITIASAEAFSALKAAIARAEAVLKEAHDAHE